MQHGMRMNDVKLVFLNFKLHEIRGQNWYTIWTFCGIFSGYHCHQCDQILQFIALWASFQSQWQQLFCPKAHVFGNYCKGVKIFHFSQGIIFWAIFMDIGRLFTGHTDCHWQIGTSKWHKYYSYSGGLSQWLSLPTFHHYFNVFLKYDPNPASVCFLSTMANIFLRIDFYFQ